MSIIPPLVTTPIFVTYPAMRRFTVDEYHRMIQTGILTADDPVELLEGWIVFKMPRNPPHDGTLNRSWRILQSRLPPGWHVRGQSAITTDDSEPEPDLAVVIGPDTQYFDHHPGPAEIEAIMEVADSTLSRDRQEKLRLYARASIVCYWIINLVDRQIEVYTDPTGPDANPVYRHRQDYGINDAVPLVIAGKEVARIPVQDFLP